MTTPITIEEIFIKFVETMQINHLSMWGQDRAATHSFYQTLIDNKSITQNQGAYIIKILYKYRNVCKLYYDYEDFLENPVWKNPFRVINNSKRIWVEQDQEKKLWFCCQFPFQLKEEFDKEFDVSYNHNSSVWDRERRIRKLSFYDFNIIQMQDFCKKHDFEFDDTFVEALAQVEEIWQSQALHLKSASIKNNSVVLENASDDASEFFESKKTGNVNSDLILAKNMGYIFNGHPSNSFEKIASNKAHKFFAKNIQEFLEISYGVNGKIVLILERGDQTENWIKFLADQIDKLGYNKKDFRICFRSSNKENPDFNKWVNENGFGGKISDAKFLIFQQKPAKWLFKDENDVIIVATNEILPGMNSTARALFNNHPCVIFIGEFKPVKNIKENIVEL